MDYDPKDKEVISLLKKLKDSNGAYPQEMLALRRQGYLKQVAEIGAGAGLAVGLRNIAKTGKGTALPPAAGNVVEMLLVVAIVAEAGAVTYFYRDRIAEFIRSFSSQPKVEQVSNPPEFSSPVVEIGLTVTPTTSTSPTDIVTGTETVVITPSLEVANNPTQQAQQGEVNSASLLVSTPQPETNQGNNGNQYGLTPKPERTQEPGNETSDTNTEDNKKDNGGKQENKSDSKEKK